jgi:hypothetical protein
MIIGVLMDVSGSMRTSLQLSEVNPGDENVSRAHSIIRTLINVTKSDHRFDEQNIFCLAFGLERGCLCDLIALLDYVRETRARRTQFGSDISYLKHLLSLSYVGISYDQEAHIEQSPGYLSDEWRIFSYEPLIRTLENNGAPFVRDYVRKHLNKNEASKLFEMFAERQDLIRKVIEDLPDSCKDPDAKAAADMASSMVDSAASLSNFFGITVIRTSADRIGKAVHKHHEEALKLIREEILIRVENPTTWTFDRTVSILKELFSRSSDAADDGREITEPTTRQVNSLLATIEPYIYGDTPMCAALKSAVSLFQSVSADDKVLFILSDGEATDGDPTGITSSLKDKGVTVFCCLLTSDYIAQPKQLYDSRKKWTSRGVCTMFDMSSEVPNNSRAMCLLLRQGWQLPSSGHSRLFVQANHPDVIDNFSSVVNKMVSSNDALLDMIGYVSLDMYINQSNSGFQPKQQVGGTCYANAVAAVFHLAMSRIVGRDGGIPDFFNVRQDLIAAYGSDGANTRQVLADKCPEYRLHFQPVNATGARQALNHKRPVVVTFWLSDKCDDKCTQAHVHVREAQWQRFSEFFRKTPSGILSRVDIGEPGDNEEPGGHAVVLVRCDAVSLTFMNSWGTKWADGGFFSISSESVLNDMKFYDVYWTLNDLKKNVRRRPMKHFR